MTIDEQIKEYTETYVNLPMPVEDFKQTLYEAKNREKERIVEEYGSFGDGCGCCQTTDLRGALSKEI